MRVLVKIICGVLLAAAIALATVPWWLGWTINPVLRRWGGRAGAYERIGYARFRLRDVEIVRRRTTVRAATVELDTPVLWCWRHLRGEEGALQVGTWQVIVGPRVGPPRAKEGWVETREKLLKIAAGLDQWVPRVTIGPGSVRWPGAELELAKSQWSAGTLAVEEVKWARLSGAVTARFEPKADRIGVSATVPNFFGRGQWVSEGPRVRGTIRFHDQAAELDALFVPNLWIPEEAHVKLSGGDFAGQWVPQAAPYERIKLDGGADWAGGRLTFAVDGKGEPKSGANVPPWKVKASGNLEENRWRVDALDLEIPGLSAKLSSPLDLAEGRLAGATDFSVHGNWEALGLVRGWRGAFAGRVSLSPSDGRWPRAQATAEGRDWDVEGMRLKRVAVDVEGDWPRAKLKQLRVEMEGANAVVSGTVDVERKSVEAGKVAVEAMAEGVKQWLPQGGTFRRGELEASFSGPWTELNHEGQLRIERVQMSSQWEPSDLDTTWTGVGGRIGRVEMAVTTGLTTVKARGSVDQRRARVEALDWTRQTRNLLGLKHPFAIDWGQGEVKLDGAAEWTGEDRALKIEGVWGRAGRITMGLRNLDSELWSDFLVKRMPPMTVASLSLEGSWAADETMHLATNGRIRFPVQGAGQDMEVQWQAGSDGKTTRVAEMRVFSAADVIGRFSGEFPLRIHPMGTSEFDTSAPWKLEGNVNGSGPFWELLAQASGVRVTDPRLEVRLEGSADRPEGKVDLAVSKIEYEHPGRSWPAVANLQMHIEANKEGLTIAPAQALVEGQEIRLRGRWPAEVWEKRRVDSAAAWIESGEVDIEVPGADLAAVARQLQVPGLRKGILAGKISARGGSLSGTMRVSEASTRPLGQLGAFQDVDAQVELQGRAVKIIEARGTLGGESVQVSGTMAWPADEEPRYDLHVVGQNVPLVRKEGLLLRSDLDLTLANPEGGVPTIGGKVQFRHGLFFSDIRAFFSASGQTAAKRPPYFSVGEAPFKDWRLAVELAGDRFMNVSSTLFNGTISAKFKMLGTLGEPRAIGELTIAQGQLLFPFASFDVSQGSVRLTEARPFEPEILLTGTSQRYNYELRVEASGPVTSPNIRFSASPALTTEQILNMVMAGEVPQNEVTTTSTQRLAAVGSYLGQSFLNALGGSSGADRLSITTGERISTQGKETYRFEYRLNHRWALIGEYDEFDQYSAGVKWRMLQREHRNHGDH